MKMLTATELPLKDIFCSKYDFSIPDYQRPYSWGTEEALQLLDDLVGALDGDADSPYFLGSVVLVKTDGDAAAQVIDGQQRLTTLTILISVLRHLIEQPGVRASLGRMLNEDGDDLQDLEPKPRLRLRPRDADFFRAAVQNLEGLGDVLATSDKQLKDAQQAVVRNTKALHAELSTWPEPRLILLSKLLSNRTYVVVVSTPDLNSAHRIFSVMNSRGLDLTPSDIFKAQVIGTLPEVASQAYADKWENAEEALGRNEFADLFLHLRMLIAKKRPLRELLREFPEQVLADFLPDRSREFVDELLLPYAKAYGTLNNASYSAAKGAGAVNRWLRRLLQLDNNDWRPAAMWALRHHGDDPAWLDAFLARLERLAASLFLRRTYGTPRIARYIQLLRELDAGDGLESAALELSADEQRETLQQLRGEVYTTTKTRRFVLLRLDEMLAGSSGASYEHAVITVEHVLPQNPKPDSQWLVDFDEDERDWWTHRLANLVLLSSRKNSEAQNYDFVEKKKRYFQSEKGVANFALTTQVVNAATWTPASLQVRQDELVGTLAKGWSLHVKDVVAEPGPAVIHPAVETSAVEEPAAQEDRTHGTYRVDDSSRVVWADALAGWTTAAEATLRETAHHYSRLMTYAELGEDVQASSGVRTKTLLQNWIGQVLAGVAQSCADSGEVMLTSLCVHRDGTVGAGYAQAVAGYSGARPDDPEMDAADARLSCYRKYAVDLPADGGSADLTPQERARRQAAAPPPPLRTCPVHNTVMPTSGRCDDCD